ncbi:MAG: DUF922 domain-containing Zn-dependent protease [Desulfobacterales bacterium]|nr:MAG: DUF922 domain-containing Zn-dependent protease [Desulfobacterales bacterium]
MFKYLSGKIVIALLLGLASFAAAESSINISYDYYDIEGRTADELRQQMNIHGVLWTNANIYDAFTAWDVKWQYQYQVTEEGCVISAVTTTLKVEFRLPRWVNYSDGPAALQQKWDVYMQSLRQHENGHKKIGMKAAADIEQSIAALKPARTCDELAETANELGRHILSRYAEKEKAYDAQTNFGETHGAIFP